MLTTTPDAVPDLEKDDGVKLTSNIQPVFSRRRLLQIHYRYFGMFCAFTLSGLDAEVSATLDAEFFASLTRSSAGFATGY